MAWTKIKRNATTQVDGQLGINPALEHNELIECLVPYIMFHVLELISIRENSDVIAFNQATFS